MWERAPEDSWGVVERKRCEYSHQDQNSSPNNSNINKFSSNKFPNLVSCLWITLHIHDI